MVRYFRLFASSAAACGLALALLVPMGTAQAGKTRILYAFKGGSDGSDPASGVIRDPQGNLYGTTYRGGTGCNGTGCGTVFKLAPDGTEIILYAFQGGADGAAPLAGLVRDSSGNLYGTTSGGGDQNCASGGCGTVFKVTPNGAETVIHAFHGSPDGATPVAGLLRDKVGNLYGTTWSGGNKYPNGTVFKIAPDGSETVLHAFTGNGDGANPLAKLIADKAGNLYGTTYFGGNAGDGTVFRVATNGTESVLYSFCAQDACLDGQTPISGVVMDTAGNLYGDTSWGGANNEGVVYKIATNGSDTVIHSFNIETDGSAPEGDLIIDNAGNIHGALQHSFDCNGSSIFSMASDGSEKIYCSTALVVSGVIEHHGIFYGTAWEDKHPNGLVFSVKK